MDLSAPCYKVQCNSVIQWRCNLNTYKRRRMVDCLDHEVYGLWCSGVSLREIASGRGVALSAIAVRVSRHRDRFQLGRDGPCGVQHPAGEDVPTV